MQAATGLTSLSVRDALRELSALTLVTNDSIEALREVVRTRSIPGRSRAARGQSLQDPTRWLPENFEATPGRPVYQRVPSQRRLPKWRRPDLPGPVSGWVGRWSLLRTPGTWGTRPDEEEHAEQIARQWLDRYAIVTRDWWRRERPPVGWRAIYRELKRLEYRGEVRRGYFVEGMGGAQFALPEAVERLRAQPDLDARRAGDRDVGRGSGESVHARAGVDRARLTRAPARRRRIAAHPARDRDHERGGTRTAHLDRDRRIRCRRHRGCTTARRLSLARARRRARERRAIRASRVSTASPRARARTPRQSWTPGGVARRMGWCSTGCDAVLNGCAVTKAFIRFVRSIRSIRIQKVLRL